MTNAASILIYAKSKIGLVVAKKYTYANDQAALAARPALVKKYGAEFVGNVLPRLPN